MKIIITTKPLTNSDTWKNTYEADLVIKLNDDGTYKVVKSRWGQINLDGKLGEILDMPLCIENTNSYTALIERTLRDE